MPYDEINIEDFPESYQDVVNVIGIELALTLSQQFGGVKIYIPKLDDLNRQFRNSKIRKAFTGSNINELCQRFSLTETQIRNILKVRTPTIEEFIEKEEEK